MQKYTLSLPDIDKKFTIQTLETFLGQVDNLELLVPCSLPDIIKLQRVAKEVA